MDQKIAEAWNPHSVNHHTNTKLNSFIFLEKVIKFMSRLNNFYFGAVTLCSQLNFVPITKNPQGIKKVMPSGGAQVNVIDIQHPILWTQSSNSVFFKKHHFILTFEPSQGAKK